MSDKRTTNFSKRKRYSNKKKTAKPNVNQSENISNDRKSRQSIDSNDLKNVLSVYNFQKNLHVTYYGWNLFFHDEEYKNDSKTVKKIQCMENFLDRQQHMSCLLTVESLEAGVPFTIDICDLYSDNIFLEQWPDFKKDIYDNPAHSLNCIKLAIHQKILETVPQESLKTFVSSILTLPTIRLKILNYQPIMCLRDLKINSYGKLISTKGCVIRVGRVRQLAQWIVFSCSKCSLQKIMKQPEGIYTVPKKCDVCGITKFSPILDSLQVKSIPCQMIRIQEHLSDEQENKGRMPRMLDVELVDDLVNTCMPGDDIILTGIVKVQGDNDTTSKQNAANSFSLCMEAVSIINSKHRIQSKNIMDNEMTVKDYFAIKEVYNEPNIFPLLVHSLCPSIYGHEMIKAGLILSLFGGNARHSDLREDIHVLIVGDPGLGKSQMLQACARVAAKGVYVCGNSSTSSGLTVTLTKEIGTNDFALEPGALVLADRGCCCIDEFDKMSTQHPALLEAMEQQCVSVAKSGVVCSLPARTSILAAANPIGGRYDRSKTIIQNLNMGQPLLSRFDLVFLLLDQPNTYLDNLLCKHVMTIHTGSNVYTQSKTTVSQHIPETSIDFTLREKLLTSSEKKIDVIPHSILRKYITYARQYVKPKLSEKAAAVLKAYYLELRSKNEGYGGLPVFNRQLEAMIRLTEARAKLELRTEATEADAFEVIEILKYTMTNTLDDDITLTLPASDDGRLTDRKVKAFVKLLKNEVKGNKERTLSANRLNEIAERGGILVNDFPRFISKLNEQGILLKTGRNVFKFVND